MKTFIRIILVLVLQYAFVSTRAQTPDEDVQKLARKNISQLDALIKESPGSSKLYLDRGSYKYELKDFEGALADFETVLKFDPLNSDAHLSKGDCYQALNQKEKACESWSTAKQQGNIHARDKANQFCTKTSTVAEQTCKKFEEGLYLSSALNKDNGAKNYVDSLRQCMSESAALYLSIGKYYYNENQLNEAEKQFSKAVTAHDVDNAVAGESHYYLGLIAYYQNRNDLAIRYAELSLKEGFKPSWNYNSIGLAQCDNRDYDASIRSYKKALALDQDALYYNNIGVSYDWKGEEYQAYSYFRIADSLVKGEYCLYRSNLTRSLSDLGRKKESNYYAAKNFEKFPNSKRVLQDNIYAHTNQDKNIESLPYARKLLSLRPADQYEWFAVAYSFDQAGKHDSAYYFYNAVLRFNPDHTSALNNLGIILKQKGLFEKAREKYEKVLSINPNSYYSLSAMVELYMWQYDYETAYKWMEKSYALHPNEDGEHLRMGYVLMHLKRYKEAIGYFRKQLALHPLDDRAINNTGRCYTHLKQRDSAMFYFTKANKIDPENSYVYHNRAVLYYDMGEYDLACADLKTAIDKEYNWVIDEKLIRMVKKRCPEVNTDRKILIYEYKGNEKEMAGNSFIALNSKQLEEKLLEEIKIEEVKIENASNTSNSFDSFSIYPNPGTGKFILERKGSMNEKLEVKVYSETGRHLFTESMPTLKKEFSLKNPEPGLYIIMVVDNHSVLTVKKLVVN